MMYLYLLRQMESYDRAAGVQIPVQGGEATDLPLVQYAAGSSWEAEGPVTRALFT